MLLMWLYKKRGSLTMSLVPPLEALAFAHPVKNEQRRNPRRCFYRLPLYIYLLDTRRYHKE